MPPQSKFDATLAVLWGPGLSVALLLAGLPLTASAALGEPEAALATEAQTLKSTVKVTERTAYRVHTLALPSGTVLREYATAGGNVFAVAWSGPTIPNLRQALGAHFAAFADAAQTNRLGRRHFQLEQTDLVMQSGGRMRAFAGRAYLPQELPAGINVDDLR